MLQRPFYVNALRLSNQRARLPASTLGGMARRRADELFPGLGRGAQRAVDLYGQRDSEVDQRQQQRLRQLELKAVGFVHL